MKTASRIFLIALSIVVLSWFLPWLYAFLLPEAGSEPYLAYSPVSDCFIVSEKNTNIYSIDKDGQPIDTYTVEQRDSLLPHQYFNQLIARDKLPDSIAGIEVTVPALRHAQWVFMSNPRDINRVAPNVYMIMESMPARFELEDPTEVFRLSNKVEFINMETNSINSDRSARFTKAFTNAGFKYPEQWMHANITSRKQFDEGYLMIDAAGDLYHMKQQAGRPFIVKVSHPDANPDFKADKAFILENMDHGDLGYVIDTDGNSYLLKCDSYKLVKLPIAPIDPTKDRITVIATLFNITLRISDTTGSHWYAITNDATNSLLGSYFYAYPSSTIETIGEYLFPFSLRYTTTNDCLVYPRIGDISWKAIYLNILLAIAMIIIGRRRNRRCTLFAAGFTIVFGLFSFIPYVLLRK
jgi:hypothetical protein